MTTAHDVSLAARQFLGIRFMHQGRSLAGLDCLGLLIVTANRCDLHFDGKKADALDIPHYGNRPDAVLLKEKLDKHLQPITLEAVREGDIVLLTIEGLAQHLALITDYPIAGERGMIHAYAPARKVIEHRYDTLWWGRSCAAYRLPQLANSA